MLKNVMMTRSESAVLLSSFIGPMLNIPSLVINFFLAKVFGQGDSEGVLLDSIGKKERQDSGNMSDRDDFQNEEEDDIDNQRYEDGWAEEKRS